MSSAEMDDKATAPESVKRPDFLEKSEYYRKILDMQGDYPHLKSLSLYMEMTEKLRIEGKLGSHSSDSILFVDIPDKGLATCHRIDCYEKEKPLDRLNVDNGWSKTQKFSSRIVVAEDLSPAAIDILGMQFDLDPHIFYHHLGLDSLTSVVSGFATLNHEVKAIPIPICMEGYIYHEHPKDYCSVQVPYDARSMEHSGAGASEVTKAYSRINHHTPMLKPESQEGDFVVGDTSRSYYRLSTVRTPTSSSENEMTVVVLAFPTWFQYFSEVNKTWSVEVPTSDFGMHFKGWRGRNYISSIDWYEHKKGIWDQEQWERIEPIFRSLICGLETGGTINQGCALQRNWKIIQRNAVFWLYSIMERTFYQSLQCELYCWQHVQSAFDSIGHLEPLPQHSKRQLREHIRKTIDIIKASRPPIEGFLQSFFRDGTLLRELEGRLDCILSAKRKLITDIQQSIDDYQGEAEMRLIIAKFKRLMTPPSSPMPGSNKNESMYNIMEMLEKSDHKEPEI